MFSSVHNIYVIDIRYFLRRLKGTWCLNACKKSKRCRQDVIYG